MADNKIPLERTFPAIDIETAQRRAREQQERFLADSVMREDMTPVEADALATGLGVTFDGQHWPAAIDDPYWPLAFAILWVSWRDPESVARQWDRFRVWAGRIWRDPRHENQTESLQEAEASIWKALESGKVRAAGLPFMEADTVDIPAVQWRNLQWMPDQKMISVRNYGQVDSRYRCVDVESAGVLALWPVYSASTIQVALGAPTASEPQRKERSGSNQGGRVMADHWHDMWAEVCRIVHEEGIPPDRLILAKRMQQWFEDRGVDAPAPQKLNPVLDRLFQALGR